MRVLHVSDGDRSNIVMSLRDRYSKDHNHLSQYFILSITFDYFTLSTYLHFKDVTPKTNYLQTNNLKCAFLCAVFPESGC